MLSVASLEAFWIAIVAFNSVDMGSHAVAQEKTRTFIYLKSFPLALMEADQVKLGFLCSYRSDIYYLSSRFSKFCSHHVDSKGLSFKLCNLPATWSDFSCWKRTESSLQALLRVSITRTANRHASGVSLSVDSVKVKQITNSPTTERTPSRTAQILTTMRFTSRVSLSKCIQSSRLPGSWVTMASLLALRSI